MKCDSYEIEYVTREVGNGWRMVEMQSGRPCKKSVVIQYLPSNDEKYPWSGRCSRHAKELGPDIKTKSV